MTIQLLRTARIITVLKKGQFLQEFRCIINQKYRWLVHSKDKNNTSLMITQTKYSQKCRKRNLSNLPLSQFLETSLIIFPQSQTRKSSTQILKNTLKRYISTLIQSNKLPLKPNHPNHRSFQSQQKRKIDGMMINLNKKQCLMNLRALPRSYRNFIKNNLKHQLVSHIMAKKS